MAASRQFSSEGGIGDKQTQIRGWSILDAEPEGGFRVQGRVIKLVWGLARISCPIKGRSFQEHPERCILSDPVWILLQECIKISPWLNL